MTFSNTKNIRDGDERNMRYVTVDDSRIRLGMNHKIFIRLNIRDILRIDKKKD